MAALADHNLQGAESALQCGTGVRAEASARPESTVRVGAANLQQDSRSIFNSVCKNLFTIK